MNQLYVYIYPHIPSLLCQGDIFNLSEIEELLGDHSWSPGLTFSDVINKRGQDSPLWSERSAMLLRATDSGQKPCPPSSPALPLIRRDDGTTLWILTN